MSRPRVLLADDHTMVAYALASLLRDDFELVDTVGDGQALIEAAQRIKPDVIVTDVEMPVMGGLEALRRLRGDGLDVRIIFLTAHADAQLADEALRAGADGFLLKYPPARSWSPPSAKCCKGGST